MHLDCRDFPIGYHLAAVVAEKLGIYVKVANFTEQNGHHMFRMIIDAEVDKNQLRELIASTFSDMHGTYEFFLIEAIFGPIIDDANHRNAEQHYQRVTFM